MIPVIPWYIELISVATSFAIAIAVWAILSAAVRRSSLPPAARQRVRIGAAILLAGWLGAALLLAPAPQTLVAQDPFAITPVVPLFMLGPIVLALIAIGLSSRLREVLSGASLPAMIGVQLYRTIGVVFLILLAQGQLPPHFALPAGWGDIAVGLSAPLAALALARKVEGGRTLAVAWNVFGLLDLVVAAGMGSGLLAPLLVPELGPRVAPAAAMGIFPMILVPTFAVPVSVLLHLLALGRLTQGFTFGPRLLPKDSRHLTSS